MCGTEREIRFSVRNHGPQIGCPYFVFFVWMFAIDAVLRLTGYDNDYFEWVCFACGYFFLCVMRYINFVDIFGCYYDCLIIMLYM